MVARISTGKSIRAMIYYNENKVEEKEANLIMASGFARDIESMSVGQKLHRFTHLTQLKPNVKTNALHISIVAVEYLFKAKPNDKELSELINELIKDSGERWTPRVFNDPKKELTELKNDLAKTGIIWVYSAFDVFFKKMEGSLSGFFKDQAEVEIAVEAVEEDEEDEPDEEEKKETKIIALYKKLGWPLDKIQDLLPILKFYELLRHCVAHRSGYPSEKLVKVSNSDEFKNAIANWKTKFTGKIYHRPLWSLWKKSN